MQRRIPPDDAIKSPNERMPTGATGRFAPATSRHPPLSRRTRRVLANTDSPTTGSICPAHRSAEFAMFISFHAARLTKRRARPAIDASSLTHFSFRHPTIFRFFHNIQ
ncbi:hypothetical protein [Burkholderia vietnamiensis]|uniref:hypothetical protein n=1 Tax=Burkholderia vietnamiensis TaxID=60552 RepID=UPI001C64D478|nr:hypothetical protein [Burkholderia vietnamiensis]